ncbi:hypothetical protein BSKO_06012 [Bryopsis sp. KO-2023]|nr:hypothetical protein BSKO_06012 [Bryopsis sp. KO-2023]
MAQVIDGSRLLEAPLAITVHLAGFSGFGEAVVSLGAGPSKEALFFSAGLCAMDYPGSAGGRPRVHTLNARTIWLGKGTESGRAIVPWYEARRLIPSLMTLDGTDDEGPFDAMTLQVRGGEFRLAGIPLTLRIHVSTLYAPKPRPAVTKFLEPLRGKLEV